MLSPLPFIGNQRSACEAEANCNPDVHNIRIFNPIIALQMLIINAAGLQIRPNSGAVNGIVFNPSLL